MHAQFRSGTHRLIERHDVNTIGADLTLLLTRCLSSFHHGVQSDAGPTLWTVNGVPACVTRFPCKCCKRGSELNKRAPHYFNGMLTINWSSHKDFISHI